MLKQHPIIVLLLLTVASTIQVNGMSAEQMDCLAKNNAKPEDIQHLANFEGFTENVHCALKCLMELDKIINEDGSINGDNIEKCEMLNKLPDEQKAKFKECLRGIDKIETCQDMLKISPCGEGVDF